LRVLTLNTPEDELIDKLLLQVLNDHALGAESESFLLDLSKVLLLANIGKESHNSVALKSEPREDRRRVKSCATLEIAGRMERSLVFVGYGRHTARIGAAQKLLAQSDDNDCMVLQADSFLGRHDC
jgi:hypothetical protein